jgi:electron transfer flavoprotein alpha subunit
VLPTAHHLIGEAKLVADLVEGCNGIDAIVFCETEDMALSLDRNGAHKIFWCVAKSGPFDHGPIVATITKLISDRQTSLVMFVDSAWARDIAPRISAALGGAMVSNCMEVQKAQEEGFTAWQAIHGGRLYRECSVPGNPPIVVSWCQDALTRRKLYEEFPAEIVEIPLVQGQGFSQLASSRVIPGNAETISLDQADRVLAFGRGMNPEDLPMLLELSKKLNASVGGTRPVIDAGLLPLERQIGQTGVLVSPQLLLALGISGAHEFAVGVEGTQLIVAVTTDPQARILSFADLGLVGEGGAVVRHLLRMLNADRSEETV